MRRTVAYQKKVLNWLDKYLRYVNYVGAAQLYLKENCLLDEEIKPEHIKDRILGHWGTVPGLNFIYAHLNRLICKEKCSMLYIAGPGHGAPAVWANLLAENTVKEFYPELVNDRKGSSKLIKLFSWPGGFPSHTTPLTPGSILEGGELGYSLATAFGAVMDNPDLIAACVIGDGEAETGPLCAAWHGNKFLNPATSGAVLPILLVNGYKISNPTIYATMSDSELIKLFEGFGYEVYIVNDLKKDIYAHEEMISALDKFYAKLKKIQKDARGKQKKVLKPIWPMIIYRTLKGKSGIEKADGHKVEGHFYSHGVPIEDPKKNEKHFELIKKWLESYEIQELIDKNGKPKMEVLQFVPKGDLRMGMNKHAIGGNVMKSLKLPELEKFAVKFKVSGEEKARNTAVASDYIAELMKKNMDNFRFFCPDEALSNKFNSVVEQLKRAYMWPVKAYDENIDPFGRVVEALSEHNIQGWLQGYVLTGRHGVFATYEAFAQIISSMVDQYAKFLKYSSHVKFRTPLPSMNYILTSVGWRQEHNGFSHQNPGFISNLLEKHGDFTSVYLPADANSLLVTLEDCFKRKNSINAIVAGKQFLPQWLSLKQAREQIKTGIGIWDFLDKSSAENPDVVLACAGDFMVQESMIAYNMLKNLLPELKIRFVNVSELTALGVGDEKRPLSEERRKAFVHYFTADRGVVFAFHGYPGVIKQLISGHPAVERFKVHGYIEEGTTTTPFDMMVLNECSRYHLAMEAINQAVKFNKKVKAKSAELIKQFEKKIKEHRAYILKYGKDIE